MIGFERETACLVVKYMLEAEVILKSAEGSILKVWKGQF